MSKSEFLSSNDLSGAANQCRAYKCIKCHCLFCINCEVPSHRGMSCFEYKRLNPRGEIAKLKSLASLQLWRQCVKCNHMIELAEGCYHMSCRGMSCIMWYQRISFRSSIFCYASLE